jgi:hypothetical protein
VGEGPPGVDERAAHEGQDGGRDDRESQRDSESPSL